MDTNYSSKFGYTGLVFLVFVAILLICIGGFGYYQNYHFLQTGIWTQGTVSGQNFQDDPDGYFYSPIVVYKDRQGNQHTWISNTGYNPPRFSIGQVLNVVYKETNPDEVILVDFWDMYLFDIVMMILGGGVLIVSLLAGMTKRS